jgi:spermidine/putrescine transport system ATP-binding protein
MSVAQNITFPLRMAGKDEDEIRRRLKETLELVHLADKAQHFPHELSGGQKQRVALARGLINKPRLLLLDEPLGALDAKLRRMLQEELRTLHREVGITFVYVTHDQEEALTMSDRLAVMRSGVVEQVGTPREVYNEPASTYVADFLGLANLLTATVVSTGPVSTGAVEVAGTRLAADAGALTTGAVCTVLARPERVRLVPPGGDGLAATVEQIVFAGPVTHVHVRWADQVLQAVVPNDGAALPAEVGGEVGLVLGPDALRVLPA